MIEILCTIAGIMAGVAIVASLFHYKGDRARFEADVQPESPERIKGIADQLQIISNRVAANVSAHSEKVGNFSDQIEPSTPESEHLLTSIDEIIQANSEMQTRLANAQKRIAQQSEMIEQASQQARTDALTGLANRRALDEFVGNCISTYCEDDVIGLLMMDIDHFKNFNDSFGHTTGDAVLASFARAIMKCCGQECYTARFGGEEFAVILTGDTPTQVAEKAANIRKYVSDQVISYEDLQLKITSSAGVCILSPDDTVSGAYERADEGLYQSKKSGRNQGHWLSAEGWVPFPEVEGEPLESSYAGERRLPITEEEEQEARAERRGGVAPTEDESTGTSAAPAAEAKTQSPENQDQPTAADEPEDESEEEVARRESARENAGEQSEILDLNSFLVRMEPYVEQLRRAELPMTGLMVEAMGLDNLPEEELSASWNAVMSLVQLNLRGIDIVCQFRRHTLCIFMPGCSQDAAVDRAAQINNGLDESLEHWEETSRPERLAISISAVNSDEECSQFLNRLESALDEAQDAGPSQVVIDDGECCHYQDL